MKMILTVSPVALAATAEPRHVLLSNTWSKAVLRLAAEELCALPGVYYFPAYEIIGAGGTDYLAADRRSVLEQGVRRVMELFFRHMLDGEATSVPLPEPVDFTQRGKALMDALCDEQRLDPADCDAGTAHGAHS
jgi:hypothetical protein